MLANRDYPIAEMEKLLRTKGKQNIDRKLERYGIDFSSDGYGDSRIYTIKHIPDPFKVWNGLIAFGVQRHCPRSQSDIFWQTYV